MASTKADILLQLYLVAIMYELRIAYLFEYHLYYHLWIKEMNGLLMTGGNASLICIFSWRTVGDPQATSVIADYIQVLPTSQVP